MFGTRLSSADERPGDSVTLSVVIPAYNEIRTIAEVLSRVRRVDVSKEIIVIDDGSSDGTREYLGELASQMETQSKLAKSDDSRVPLEDNNLVVIFQSKNQGKGAALRRGFEAARGKIVVIQDADLELNPEEYPKLIEPILAGRADVVYGSRFLASGRNGAPISRYLANRILTLASNLCTGQKLTDVWTGYKTFRSDVLKEIQLCEDRFGFEPEVTAKLARLGCRIAEVSVSYDYRTYSDGKKISWKDGFYGVWCTLRLGIDVRLTDSQ